MKSKSFLQTREGGLTIAFLVIMGAFLLIMDGLGTENDVFCGIGFILMIAAMLYSPLKVYVIDRKKSKG